MYRFDWSYIRYDSSFIGSLLLLQRIALGSEHVLIFIFWLFSLLIHFPVIIHKTSYMRKG